MSQIFHPSMNTVAKATIFGAVFIIAGLGVVGASIDRSPYETDQGVVRAQPVPFSHEHHVRGLGIDCRYCHTSVEKSGFAGLPPTHTCMTCHSKIWTDASLLAPVRESWRTNTPIQWTRVHNLPGYAYFNHSIHIAKGVGCASCHGPVNEMPLMYQAASLQMEWCLGCHRNPENFVRPKEKVFDIDWNLGNDPATQSKYGVTTQVELGQKLVQEYHIPTDGRLATCSTCHR